MLLVQHDDVIERVSAYTADDPLRIRILPGRLRGDFNFFNIHMLNPLLEPVAVDAIPRLVEITGRLYPTESDKVRRLSARLKQPLDNNSSACHRAAFGV